MGSEDCLTGNKCLTGSMDRKRSGNPSSSNSWRCGGIILKDSRVPKMTAVKIGEVYRRNIEL